ncbi:MAG: M43 family zinc metalloprotease, partial [Flavobacteriales bacterium]|nr:M43 family zinc metalloprotease [Flavobacteriales bacterium]
MKKPLLTLAACALGTGLLAQSTPHFCSTDEVYHQMVASDPHILTHRAALEAAVQEYLSEADLRDDQEEITIPLVFHVLHLKGIENITTAQIVNQVALLNRDFATLNADTSLVIDAFQDRIGRSKIQFALATKDKFGNCTNGIDRIETVQTLYGGSFSKANQWPRNKYMNIWVARSLMEPGVAAYALYPGSTEGLAQLFDGIMSRHNYVGNTGTASGSDGRTITHEMGHSLNLSHVWGDTNDPGIACGDDGVPDTPLTLGHSGGCPTGNVGGSARCDRMAFLPELNTGIFTFDEVTTTSGTTDPFNPPAVIDTITDVVRTTLSAYTAAGVGANSTVNGQFAFAGWGTGAEDGNTSYADLTGAFDTGDYYQLTLSPAVTDVVKVDTLVMRVGRSHDGPRTFSVRNSFGNFGTNLTIIPADTHKVAMRSGNVAYFKEDTEDLHLVRVVGPVTNFVDAISLRTYAWNAETADGAFILDSVRVVGASGAIENFQNYMDYSSCGIMYTHGQIDRMYATLFSPVGQRNELWTPENLVATGVAEGSAVQCGPEADFYAVVGQNVNNPAVPFTPMACAGTNVRFVDNSARATATSWSWTFQDGDPATSNAQQPLVEFTSPGWKSVTLTVSNEHGESSKTIENAVFISAGGSNMPPPLYKGFESGSLHPMHAFNHDHNHTYWQSAFNISSTGNGSLRLNSGEYNPLDL